MSFNSKYTGAQVEAWLDNIKNYSANDILEKLKTVDGSNSGLDADLLDGKQPSELNVGSATKLQTARTIWGQNFDGTGDVSGNLTGVGSITMSSNIFMNNNMGIAIKNTSGANKYILLLSNNNRAYFGQPDLDSYIRGNNVNITYGSSQTSGIYLKSSGNIGIGTTDPSYKLDVNGSLKITDYIDVREPNTKNRVTTYLYSGIGRIYSYNDDNGYNDLYLGQNSTNAIVVKANGNVGIGAGSPAYKLDVSGDIHASGSVTQNSDINLKNISKDVLISLDDISKAPLFEFTYKNDENKRVHVGTSAQYWVEKNNWFCKKQDNGYYDMEIQNLALASAISIAKEFKKYKEETESTISSMKNEIEELKQIVLNMNK